MSLLRRNRLPAPRPGTPWREAEFCVLDFETTGMDLRRDDIVSYGATVVAHGRIRCGQSVYRLVRPDRAVSIASMSVHNLRPVDLADAPTLDEVIDELIGLLAQRVLVAHAAWFDWAFLDRALRRRGLRPGWAVVDTGALLRACGLSATGSDRESSVEAAARRLGLPVHTPHHALGDAMTTAQLLLVTATRLEQRIARPPRRPLTVRQLCDLSRS